MENAVLYEGKPGDRIEQSGTGSKIFNTGMNDIDKNESGSGGSNRGGKRYQNSRTIAKRKDNSQKQHDTMNINSNLQELNKQLQANLPEDMRISKLLRRLCQENDVKVCLDLCSKLGVVILEPCNESYIRKSFDILADGIISVIENGPRDCLDNVAELFGMMGYVNRSDFTAYRAWIIKYYKNSKKMKQAMIKAIKKTVSLDVKVDMKETANRLMDLLKDYLEMADTIDTFVAVTDVIVDISGKYPKCFQTHFTDIVDIVVGWHLETDQIPKVKIHCSKVQSWIEYEHTKDKNAIDMADWEQVDFGTDILNNFSCHKMVSDTENSIAAIFMLQHTPEKEEKVRMCSEVIHSALQECLLTKSREYLFQMTITNHIAYIAQLPDCTADDLKSIRVDKQYGSFTIMRVLSWIEFFDNNNKCQQNNMEMRLDLVSVARKENNLSLCQRELEAFYKSYDIGKLFCIDQHSITIDRIQRLLMSDAMKCDLWDVSLSRAVYEQCKWLYCQSNRKQQAIQFASVATAGISEKLAQFDLTFDNSLREREARFLLTIADWVQNEDSEIFNEPQSNSPLVKLICSLPELEPSPDPRMISIFSIMDIVVGKLLQASVRCCPDLAKAWCQFGSWSYRWGKKMVEFNTEGNTLHIINQEEIKKILPATSSDNIQKITIILNQHEVGEEEEEIGLNEMSSTGLLESLQITIPELRECSAEKLQSIVEIWRQTHRTVYGYYEIAASAYFRYLQLSSSIEMESENGNSSTVTATLRLLRLIVKHALGLKEVLEEGLATTPTNPWRVIIPQLFSRLNHHEPYVRKRVSELLCRVAKDAPHLIIFPAVVGSVQEKNVDVGNISLNKQGDDMKPSGVPESGLAFCFNALLEILFQDAPETVRQVQVLVYELRRISLLWDELWIISLQQIYSEYNKRFTSFENELQKLVESELLESRKNLIIEKHKLLLRPLIFVMEQLYEMTCRPSQTIYEKQFQERYLKYINAMIDKFKEPFDFKKPVEGWTRFKALLGQMQQRGQKKNAFTLRLSEISPVLAKLSKTAISMPGIDCTQKKQIFISSVDNSVQILPTKTKPKKLMFYGSNGRRYSYLFKGLEDLHLDERIMQFLSIANLMMTKSIDCSGNITYYHAEHYSVIPLGPRSGLINWVDNTVPIFSLYKKWQQREALQKKEKPATTSRPSELYYQKLTPLLQKHGLKTGVNRKDWPVSILKQVLKDLQSETPRDLLAKELWCHSTTAAAWRQVVRNYSLSIAVMSVIGYIIGLGDRHLDNILVKLASGEIVHIDYNVCFEKGKTLRVPERVPFRMTPNLEEALGITGIEGTFRLACEHVLKSLKKGRETLLTLLEAFVYDPLVDWAVTEDGGAAAFAVSTYGNREGFNSELQLAKKQLEREVNRDTLAIRFSEIKTEWNQNRDDIYQQLLLMQTCLQDLKLYRLELCTAESQRDSLSNQIQVIREAESLESAIGSHPLNTLSQRYSVYKKINDDYESVKKTLLNKKSEFEKKLEDYRIFRKDIESQRLHDLVNTVDISIEECSLSEFDQVQEFLENSNLHDVFLKANGCRHELNGHILKSSMLVKHALEMLNQYTMIMRYYPNSFEQDHKHFKFAAWYRKLLEENSQQSSQEVLHLHQQHAVKIRQHSSNQQVISFSYHLSNILSESGFRLTELIGYHARELNENTTSVDQIYEACLTTIESIAFGSTIGPQILNCAAIKLFLDLTQNYLMLEQTASTAGETLIDLQLNDNWYLTELYMASAQLKSLAQIMFEKNEYQVSHKDIYTIGSSCLSAAVDIYEYLHTMNERIPQSFLTETLQGIISENRSVIEMISAVSNLQSDTPGLSQLLDELNMHLQCVVMNIPSVHCHVITIVEELKQKFTSLGDSYQQQEVPSDGAKLFLILYSLFNELLEKQNVLLRNVYDDIQLLNEINSIDLMKESKDLAVLIFNKSTNSILENIFIVKRVQAIIDFFTSCLQMACSFKGSTNTVLFNDDLLVRPIRRFISDFVYHSMLGVGPTACSVVLYGILQRTNPRIDQDIAMYQQIACDKETVVLQELCNATIEHTLSAVHISQQQYHHANNAYIHLSCTWRKKMRIKLLSDRILTEQVVLSRIQMLLVAHSWLHETTTNLPRVEINTHVNRSAVVIQLQNFVKQLTSIKLTIQSLREEILANTTVILHRLKWSAGTNTKLIHLSHTFEQGSLLKQNSLEKHMLYIDMALNHCSSVLDHEIMHLQDYQDQQDHEFIELVGKFKRVCSKLQSCPTMVNKTEIALVELLDPEGKIDHVWIANVRALVDDMTDQVHTKIARLEKELRIVQDNLHLSAHKLRSLISAHHSVASDVRNLLKIRLKMDSSSSLREYLLKYKAFLETVSELLSNVINEDFTDELIQHAMEHVQHILSNVHAVFDKLFFFDQGSDNDVREDFDKSDILGEVIHSPDKKYNSEAKFDKVQQTQKEQKRNAYAVSVWRRIRMKLEGRDPDPNRRCTVQEQVGWMIQEAMDPDNLAVLYEGWTPWV
ncbi:serine/threonine-protein kinase Smg1 isoform X2 [Wyeomyia smithii]|uniref:serine/threonine-protein kinase Smg1 isoform X2 n=1 Tax=Wyeomyia smithii TaxID=174621 RepID=UPI00246821D7|nr:serine/threonine-protein kinase Smg1 isoform X2 [Wyeomyia smithii]